MLQEAQAAIPAASSVVFKRGIAHPDLWLWDSWTLRLGGDLNLYCLALARVADNAAAIAPHERNAYRFHVRRFVSFDDGATWRDKGAVARPGRFSDGSDSANMWSGSATPLGGGAILFAHTGVRRVAPDRPFLQSINVELASSPEGPLRGEAKALSCAERDYDQITGAGYYLGPRDKIGHADGEEGGPILAWRDPFGFVAPDGVVHLFWSAKTGPATPAIAHAILETDDSGAATMQLSPPIEFPDSDLYTQAELPKIFFDETQGLYYMLVSVCDRLYEGQRDSEITKQHRLYTSKSLEGPWRSFHEAGSLLSGLSGLFGASLIQADFGADEVRMIAPYTEAVAPALQLTFAEVKSIGIGGEPAAGAAQAG